MEKLLIFNLETDAESPVLAVGIDWILALGSQFDSVEVWSTHIGERRELGKIRVEEIGGGNVFKKIRAIFRIARLSSRILFNKNGYFIFHHMSPRTAVFPGVLFRIFGIPQGLWYSHAAKPISLRIGAKVVDHVFTSTKESFPIYSTKLSSVGHGIPVKKFMNIKDSFIREKSILYVGRISPVKRLDFLIKEVAKLKPPLSIVCFGPESKGQHARDLSILAQDERIDLKMNENLGYQEIPRLMSSHKYFFSGTKGSVDKVALEAALSGCLIISIEQNILDLTGMTAGWDLMGHKPPQNIADQIRLLEAIDGKQLCEMRNVVTEECAKRNNLENTATKIAQLLKAK